MSGVRPRKCGETEKPAADHINPDPLNWCCGHVGVYLSLADPPKLCFPFGVHLKNHRPQASKQGPISLGKCAKNISTLLSQLKRVSKHKVSLLGDTHLRLFSHPPHLFPCISKPPEGKQTKKHVANPRQKRHMGDSRHVAQAVFGSWPASPCRGSRALCRPAAEGFVGRGTRDAGSAVRCPS